MSAQISPDTRERLIRAYAEGAALLRAAWAEVPAEARQWRPEQNAWSAHEIVCHCADSEISAATRIRMVALEPTPTIVGYDQDLWTIALDYHERDAETALAVCDTVRRWTVPVLESLSEAQWSRAGTHSESGSYSATDWLRIYAAHLADHAEQIRTNIRLWNEKD